MSNSGQICNHPGSHIHFQGQNNVQATNISTTPAELFDKIIENSTGFGISIASIKESIPTCKVYETYVYSDDGKNTHKVFFISQRSSNDVENSNHLSENHYTTFAILTDRSGFNPEFISSENLENTNIKGILGGSPFRVLRNIPGLVSGSLKNTSILQAKVPHLPSNSFGVSLGITPLESEQMCNVLFPNGIFDIDSVPRKTKENAKLKLMCEINSIKPNTNTIVRSDGEIRINFSGGSIMVYGDCRGYWDSLLKRCDSRDFDGIAESGGFSVQNHLGNEVDFEVHETSPNPHFVSASREISVDFLDKTGRAYRFAPKLFFDIQRYKEEHGEESEIVALADEYDEPAEQKLVVSVDNIFSMLNIRKQTIEVNKNFEPLHITHSAFPTESLLMKYEPEKKHQLHTVATAVDEQEKLGSVIEALREAGAFVELSQRDAITPEELVQISEAIQAYMLNMTRF